MTVLCSWARHFAVTVPLSTQEYKWVLANCWGNMKRYWGSNLRRTKVTSQQGEYHYYLNGVFIGLYMYMYSVGDRCGGVMVCALDAGSRGSGSSAGQGHCVVLLGKTFYSQCLSPPRSKLVPANCQGNLIKMLGGYLRWTSIQSRRVAYYC